ncbi:MAG: hypothetical protein WAQ98_24485, partial [Blastocatellia bacterium]
EELKENLENCIRSKVSLKKELKQYSLSNLKGLLVLSEVFINNEEYFNEDLKIPNYASSSKEVVINELYKSMLKYFCLGRNLDDSVSSNDITESRLIEIVRKAISSLTQIDLKEMAKKVTLYRTFLNKALNKPKTKAEFTFFISYKGKNSLDPVQKILWNNLLRNESLGQVKQANQVEVDNTNTKAQIDASCVNASEAKQIGANIPSNVLDEILAVVDVEKGMDVLEAFVEGEKDNDESFLDHQKNYDRIILYPHSEKQQRQSIKYIQEAYDLLIARGKLVAVVSEEFFTANHREAITFRKWLKQVDGRSENLSESNPVNKPTAKSTSARIVIIDKYSLF